MKRLIPRSAFFLMIIPMAMRVAAVPEIISGPWCGAVTPVSASVNVYLNESPADVRLVVSTAADLSAPLYSDIVSADPASGDNVRLDISGLIPDTVYHYAVELDGMIQDEEARRGRFRTFPVPGAASFRFGFASCGDWNEPGQDVYEAVLAENLRFMIHMGDLNYRDTNDTDPDEYRSNYIRSLSLSPELGGLVRNLPTSYIWDDHDFAGNDSDSESRGRTAARKVYREMVPHYPLPAGGPDAAIHQKFDYGRVRFLLSDLRSERDDDGDTDNASKTMMGGPQKQWFKDQLVAARDAEMPLVVWLSGVPLVSGSTSGDNWGSYTRERQELLEFIRDEDIRNLIVISGDMHALAYDDGRATEDYVEGVRIPVFHAAALTRDGSEKGGPYSGGVSEGSGRYGVMEISDSGGSVSATYRGRIASSATSVSTWKTFTHQLPPAKPRAALSPAAVPAFEAVMVSWTDGSSVETGFRIERRMQSGEWSGAGTIPSGTSQFQDTGITPGTDYEYRVVTLNGTSEAFPSATVTATSYTRYQNWKVLRFGNPAAPDDDDADDDGLMTPQEYLFDLLPTVPDRYQWNASSPETETGHVTVTFQTSPGRSYRVQFNGDLENDWSPVSPLIPGDGSVKQWTDDGTGTGGAPAPEGRRFYRIIVSENP